MAARMDEGGSADRSRKRPRDWNSDDEDTEPVLGMGAAPGVRGRVYQDEEERHASEYSRILAAYRQLLMSRGAPALLLDWDRMEAARAAFQAGRQAGDTCVLPLSFVNVPDPVGCSEMLYTLEHADELPIIDKFEPVAEKVMPGRVEFHRAAKLVATLVPLWRLYGGRDEFDKYTALLRTVIWRWEETGANVGIYIVVFPNSWRPAVGLPFQQLDGAEEGRVQAELRLAQDILDMCEHQLSGRCACIGAIEQLRELVPEGPSCMFALVDG